jgi:hypothetical protein
LQTNPKVDIYYSECALKVDKENSVVVESYHYEYQTALIKVKGEGASSVRFKLAYDNEYDSGGGVDGNYGRIVQEVLKFGTPKVMHLPQIPSFISNPPAGLTDSFTPPPKMKCKLLQIYISPWSCLYSLATHECFMLHVSCHS